MGKEGLSTRAGSGSYRCFQDGFLTRDKELLMLDDELHELSSFSPRRRTKARQPAT